MNSGENIQMLKVLQDRLAVSADGVVVVVVSGRNRGGKTDMKTVAGTRMKLHRLKQDTTFEKGGKFPRVLTSRSFRQYTYSIAIETTGTSS